MADIGTESAVASYLASVRSALDDLPAAEVGEILDDVGPHVAEVAAELGPDDQPAKLHERLGPPQRYAAELRAAAGYPPPTGATPTPAEPNPTGRLRLALWLLVAATTLVPLLALAEGSEDGLLMLALLAAPVAGLSLYLVLHGPGGIAAMAELPEVRWLRDRNPGGVVAEYGYLFQPGWWLVRAGLAAILLVHVVGSGSVLAVLLLTVPLAVGSAWVGRRSRADRRWLWAVLPLNAFAVVFGLVALGSGTLGSIGYTSGGSYPVPSEPRFGNVYPYDSNGRPLTGVYLYDETGRPITTEYSLSYCAPTGQAPVPANRYPQPEYDYDSDGDCVVRSAVPAPPELPSGSASSTLDPSATPGATAPGASTAPSATPAPAPGATTAPGASAPPVAPTTTK